MAAASTAAARRVRTRREKDSLVMWGFIGLPVRIRSGIQRRAYHRKAKGRPFAVRPVCPPSPRDVVRGSLVVQGGGQLRDDRVSLGDRGRVEVRAGRRVVETEA